MTTNHDSNVIDLPVESIMAAGLKRISALVEQHGITSPEVFAACERWGSILDDVNFPDTTCRWCGQPVAHNHSLGWWYHKNDSSRACRTVAAAEATPLEKAQKFAAAYGSGPKALKTPEQMAQLLGPGPDAEKQKAENDRERNFDNSFKQRLNNPNVNPRLY